MESNECDEREGSPPPIGLRLELGTGYGHKTESCETKSCAFTVFQLQEFHLQSLIFKYMEAGFPVPTHLVTPIWKSISNSFGDPNGFLRQLYPSCKSSKTQSHENNSQELKDSNLTIFFYFLFLFSCDFSFVGS